MDLLENQNMWDGTASKLHSSAGNAKEGICLLPTNKKILNILHKHSTNNMHFIWRALHDHGDCN